MALRLRRVTSDEDRAAAFALRHEVFVVEQRVPEELERDEDDARAEHVLALDGDRPVATGRLVPLDARTGRIGRMAVAADARGRGAGAAVLAELERAARERGLAEALLHAQLHARGFYERAGYAAEGPEFDDAGIRHVAMRKPLGPRR